MSYEFNNIRISKVENFKLKSNKYSGCINVSVPHELKTSIQQKIGTNFYQVDNSSSSRSMNIYAHTYPSASIKITKHRYRNPQSFSLKLW